MGAEWRWLIIKTGGNQRFIFGSNKRRLNVGASGLVTRLPDWVSSAISPHGAHVRPVVVVSGVAQLLVDDLDVARAITEAVTLSALESAPSLEVWGWFEEEPPSGVSLAERLRLSLRRHEQHRQLLVPAESRNPGIPFSERCAVTSEPAAFRERGVTFGDQSEQLAPACLAQADGAHAALHRIRNEIVGADLASAVLSAGRLESDVSGAGWVAVVHADGNGFGQLFADLGSVCTDDDNYLATLSALSPALDVVAQKSLRLAIAEMERALAESRESAEQPREWILPLIVGGDDLSVVLDARLARPFTEAYLRAFEACSAENETVRHVAGALFGRDHLTACAGVAIVKPTHPFSQAYDLAEALCKSAKKVKTRTAHPVSAYDCHVFHEAAGRALDQIRGASPAGAGQDDGAFDQGPFVTSTGTSQLQDASEPDREWLLHHSAEELSAAIGDLRDGLLSGSAAYDVRAALVGGPTAFTQRRNALVARFALTARPRGTDERTTAVDRAVRIERWLDHHAMRRGLSALDLWDVETATPDVGATMETEER